MVAFSGWRLFANSTFGLDANQPDTTYRKKKQRVALTATRLIEGLITFNCQDLCFGTETDLSRQIISLPVSYQLFYLSKLVFSGVSPLFQFSNVLCGTLSLWCLFVEIGFVRGFPYFSNFQMYCGAAVMRFSNSKPLSTEDLDASR